MTESAARDRIIHTIMPAVRARVAAMAAGEQSPEPAIPDHVREAIHAGHVVQCVVFCDDCGFVWEGDVIGETRDERLAAARAYLAADLGWDITDEADLCPKCGAK
jgi:hypothetical protein